VNKLIFFSILLLLFNNCSLNKNVKIWKGKENTSDINKNVTKAFVKENKNISEFNQGLRLDFSAIKTNNKIIDDQNNFGSQTYNGKLNRIHKYKISKLEKQNNFNFKPVFLKDGIIFFDKKGSIIRYDKNQKILWKQNHYLG